jgi:hypothetical protein
VARKTLSAKTVATTKPPKQGRLELFDTVRPGLALRITPAGVRSWSLMYRVGGKLRRDTRWRHCRQRSARRFITLYARERRWSDLERILTREIVSQWESRPIGEITRRDALDLLATVKDRAPVRAGSGKPECG